MGKYLNYAFEKNLYIFTNVYKFDDILSTPWSYTVFIEALSGNIN